MSGGTAPVEIDNQIEPLVRKTLDAAVKRDEDRLQAELQAFPTEDALKNGVELAAAIVVAVLADSYEGTPTDRHLRELAEMIADMEQWSAITPELAHTYLSTLLDRESKVTIAEAIDPHIPVVLTFIIAGSLLSSSKKKRNGEWWFNYLDRIEARLEATAQ